MHVSIQQLSARIDGALDGPSLERVSRHLLSCAACREALEALRRQDETLAHALHDEPDDLLMEALTLDIDGVVDPRRAKTNDVRIAELKQARRVKLEDARDTGAEARATMGPAESPSSAALRAIRPQESEPPVPRQSPNEAPAPTLGRGDATPIAPSVPASPPHAPVAPPPASLAPPSPVLAPVRRHAEPVSIPASPPSAQTPRETAAIPSPAPILPVRREEPPLPDWQEVPVRRRSGGTQAWMGIAAAVLVAACGAIVLMRAAQRTPTPHRGTVDPAPHETTAEAAAPSPVAVAIAPEPRPIPVVTLPSLPVVAARRPEPVANTSPPPATAGSLVARTSPPTLAPSPGNVPARTAQSAPAPAVVRPKVTVTPRISAPPASARAVASSASATTHPAPSAARPVPVETNPVAAATPPPKVESVPPPQPELKPGFGLLCGYVRDSAGQPVSGARVSLVDIGVGAATDASGRFCISAPVGERTLSVAANGFTAAYQVVSLTAQARELKVLLSPAPDATGSEPR